MIGRLTAVLLGALVPSTLLLVDPWGWYPFGPAKWLAVTVLVPAASAMVLHRHPVRCERRLGWALGALVAWLAVAAWVGHERLYGWLGTPERHLGVLTWALCALAVLVGQSLDVERHGPPIAWGLAVAGLGLGAAGVAEALGWEPAVFAVTPGRLTATMGSAAYVGAATALLLPALVGVALDAGLSIRLRRASGSAVPLLAVVCVGSGARAAWFGLAISGLVAMGLHRRALLADRRRAAGAAGLAAVVAIAVVALSPAGGRLAAAFNGDEAGGRSRIDEWRVAAYVIADHPLTGVGPEGYRTTLGEGIDDAYEQAYGRDPLPDRAHSGPLDVALAGGVPALVAWTACVTILVGGAIRAMRRGRWLIAGLGAAFVAHIGEQLLLFPTAELEPAAWLLAGFVLAGSRSAAPSAVRLPTRRVPAVLGVVALIAAGAGVVDVLADHRAEDAVTALSRDDTASALRAATAASDLRPDELRLHLLRAQALLADQRGTTEALHAVKDGLARSPGDPIALRRHAELAVTLATNTHLPRDIAAAQSEVAALLDGDASNAALWLLRGASDRLAGDDVAAEAAWERAEALTPHSAAASTNLALLYFDQGRAGEARAAADRAIARDPDDPWARAARDRVGP
ncbi:MAG: O-antigen ligase family protein [Acidimicrobiales bacterium]